MMQANQTAVFCRLGIFDPCEPDDAPEFVGPVYTWQDDQSLMRLTILQFNAVANRRGLVHCIGVFPIT